MLMYDKYNKDRFSIYNKQNESTSLIKNIVYFYYRLFYTEFLTIDALINNMAIGDVSVDDDVVDLTTMSPIMSDFLNAYDNIFRMGNQIPPIINTTPEYLHELHKLIASHGHRGGAQPTPIPGRDAMNNVSTSVFTPNVATAVSTMNTINPMAVTVDPSNVLSEHVLRIMNDDSSTLSFKMDVHLIVAPGDNGISIADKVGYACESSKQDMSRSWSEITGKPYYPTARKE